VSDVNLLTKAEQDEEQRVEDQFTNRRTNVKVLKYKWIFTSELLQVNFYKWTFTSELLQVNFYKWTFTSELLQVNFYKWTYTSELLQVNFYKWTFSSELLQVNRGQFLQWGPFYYYICKSGVNPTIVSYNATSSLVRFENEKFLLLW
jgi:hypothetical protein